MRTSLSIVLALPLVALITVGCANEPAFVAPHEEPAPALEEARPVIGRVPPAREGLATIITLDPRTPRADVPLPAEHAVMDQYGRDFIPHLLVVREGQTVRFKNSEDELHTVHAVDSGGSTVFHAAMPILGGIYDYTFDRAGDYAISCNAHQEMSARIMVTSSPYAVVADREGRFSFSAIPAGSYVLTVLQGDDHFERVVEIAAGRTELVLDR